MPDLLLQGSDSEIQDTISVTSFQFKTIKELKEKYKNWTGAYKLKLSKVPKQDIFVVINFMLEREKNGNFVYWIL